MFSKKKEGIGKKNDGKGWFLSAVSLDGRAPEYGKRITSERYLLMRVDILEDKSSFGVSSEEPPLHEKTPAFPGVCVSVGDIIEDYEENTLRYVEIRRMH